MLIFANIVALFAELIGLLANANQLRHVVKVKSILGVSGWAWTLGVGGNIAWVAYGLQQHIYALSAANTLLFLVGLGMISRLYRSHHLRRQMIGYALLVGAGLSVIFMGFPNFSGWVALLYGMLSRIPQLYRAYSDPTLTGLSYRSQVALYVENTLTGVYAFLLGAWPLVVAALIGFGTGGYMILMVAKKGKTT